MATLSPRAQQVQDALTALDLDGEVTELPASARTVAAIAAAVGSTTARVAQSLLFRTLETDRAVLVVASAANAVDAGELAELVGEPIELAHPDWVRSTTGYAAGGVSPIPHDERVTVFIDEDLMEEPEIWVPAGAPNAVFRITPGRLRHATRGRVISVS